MGEIISPMCPKRFFVRSTPHYVGAHDLKSSARHPPQVPHHVPRVDEVMEGGDDVVIGVHEVCLSLVVGGDSGAEG